MMTALILSNALDTNGQNARYVKAAEKWGSDDGVLEAFAIGKTDPAGVVGRFQAASEKFGGLRIRSASKAKYEYMQFPMDIYWDRRNELEVKRLAEEADIVHLNNSYVAAQRFNLRKPMLLHHHGSLLRNNTKHMMSVARSRKMLQAVSTIDLQRPAPELLHWLPSAYAVDELAAFGEAHARKPDGRVRIVHCPTNRELKHTALFLEAVKDLQQEGMKLDMELVENMTWQESLEAKARADIVYDQLAFGYGCNSIEAWCMGKPVISGADEWTLARMAKEWPTIPFEEATETTLKDVIRAMVKSEELREDAAARGMAHVRRYHDERQALARLAELYAKAIRHYSAPRIPGKGESVTFRKHGGLAPRDLETGERYEFRDGTLTTDDPFVIARLRGLAKRPRAFGIEEVA